MHNNFQASYGILCPVWVGVGEATLVVSSQGAGTKFAVALDVVAIERGCGARRMEC